VAEPRRRRDDLAEAVERARREARDGDAVRVEHLAPRDGQAVTQYDPGAVRVFPSLASEKRAML
jgi:hypothetical protein